MNRAAANSKGSHTMPGARLSGGGGGSGAGAGVAAGRASGVDEAVGASGAGGIDENADAALLSGTATAGAEDSTLGDPLWAKKTRLSGATTKNRIATIRAHVTPRNGNPPGPAPPGPSTSPSQHSKARAPLSS